MKRHTPEYLEEKYKTSDPWGYQRTDHDAERKRRILHACMAGRNGIGYESALDIGAGEGWITKDLPASNLYGLEISENAVRRWPSGITRFQSAFPEHEEICFDLIVASGVLYDHYDIEYFFEIVDVMGVDRLVTCGYKQDLVKYDMGIITAIEDFEYDGDTQTLITYDLSAS